MVDITHVLAEKYRGMEWSLNGDPANEAEFTEGFKIHKANGVEEPTWSVIQTELVKMKAAGLWVDLRMQRDLLLHETDWTQVPDAPSDGKTAWAGYRQALRDLPANTSDPANPTWPVKP